MSSASRPNWLLIGATGMVGAKVARLASAQHGPSANGDNAPAQAPAVLLTIVARRAMEAADGVTVHVVPTVQWSELIARAEPGIFINCLGTTIRQAGSEAAFCAVDHDLALAAATAAKAAGARHCITVSSVGASAASGNFYLRTKGAVEAGLRALNFGRLDILRPGLLMGERGGPPRTGEALAMLAAPLTDRLLHGPLRRYRSVAADEVARAIVALAGTGGTGTHVHEHDAIRALAAQN